MEWQNFLNLCICQESHLKHVEDYRWVSLRAGGWGGAGGGLGRLVQGVWPPGAPMRHLIRMTEVCLFGEAPEEN